MIFTCPLLGWCASLRFIHCQWLFFELHRYCVYRKSKKLSIKLQWLSRKTSTSVDRCKASFNRRAYVCLRLPSSFKKLWQLIITIMVTASAGEHPNESIAAHVEEIETMNLKVPPHTTQKSASTSQQTIYRWYQRWIVQIDRKRNNHNYGEL